MTDHLALAFLGTFESLRMRPTFARGRRDERAGHVRHLTISGSLVVAQVRGPDDPAAFRARIAVRAFGASEWARVEQDLAAEARFAADLLAGRMPPGIGEVFDAAGLSLVPLSLDEVAMDCTCERWPMPCVHLAATCYALARAFEEEPFGIFAWRGRPRDELLMHLRDLRSANAVAAAESAGGAAGRGVAGRGRRARDRAAGGGPAGGQPADDRRTGSGAGGGGAAREGWADGAAVDDDRAASGVAGGDEAGGGANRGLAGGGAAGDGPAGGGVAGGGVAGGGAAGDGRVGGDSAGGGVAGGGWVDAGVADGGTADRGAAGDGWVHDDPAGGGVAGGSHGTGGAAAHDGAAAGEADDGGLAGSGAADLRDLATFWGAGGPPPMVPTGARPGAVTRPDALLDQLDSPPLAQDGRPITDLLRPAYQALPER